MRFSDDFIRRVVEANNLVDLISQYTQLKPTGSGLMGRCPFPDHQEKTPSFSVSEHKQVYHCFGCHKSGNIISFLRDYYGYAFPEAIEWLARRASIPMPEKTGDSSREDEQAKHRRVLLDVNRMATQFFLDQLSFASAQSEVQQYILRRGLSQETLKDFQIGFSPREWDSLVLQLEKKNISMALAEEARLVVQRKDGRKGHFDMFRNRLIFPILNTMGETVAFGGRVLDPQGQPKYLNSPETPVFEKKRVLYGLHQTARWIRSDDQAIIVEGYMDTVALYQAGIKNVAAVMSSSLTPEQAKLIKRMTKNVVMLLDGDAAGMDGAERSLPILLHGDLYPKGVFLPNGQDPDDFIKTEGVQALQERIQRAQDLLFVVLDRWMAGYRGEPPEKMKIIDKLKPILNGVPDKRLRDLYLDEVSRRLTVSQSWLRQALEKEDTNPSQSRNPSIPVRPLSDSMAAEDGVIELKEAPSPELSVMSLVLKSRANMEIFVSENIMETFSHSGVVKILQEAIRVYGQDQERFDRLTSLFVSKVDKPELLFARDPRGLKGAADFDADLEVKLLRDSLRRVQELSLREKLRKIRQELAGDPSSEKMEQLMKLQQDISRLTKG